MDNAIIPLFCSHHSISESILTVEKEEKIAPNKPVSVFAIAKTHKLSAVVLIESDISSFWKSYKVAKALDIQLIYGIKLSVCNDLTDKSPESEKTESNVIILFKNSRAYYDFVPLYSLASTTGKLKTRRLDWKTLNAKWSENFALYMPFYSSFLARNLTLLEHKAYPDFTAMKPTFFVESHDHCYDGILKNAVEKYCAANGYETQNAHQVYYYSRADAKKHLCLSAIAQRGTFDKPNLDNFFTTETFSFEDFQNKTV